MSQRSSKRLRSIPQRLEDEQATIHYQQQEDRDLQRAIQVSLEYDIEDSSDEDTSIVEEAGEEEEEEKGEPTTVSDTDWNGEATAIVPPPFTSSSGPQTSASSPLALFQLFLPLRFLRTIAANTTAYARSKGADNTWQTTAEDLYRFIAIHIAMGISPLPSVHMYWDARWRCEMISTIFTRDRYMELLRYFHISPPATTSSPSSPLSKVEPLLSELSASFSAFYLPGQTLVVDEAMVGFKGRSEMKQYIKNKPTKWGYKVWCLASSNYLLAFQVYEGRRSSSSISSPHEAVLSLIHNYQHRNHILYLDRGFTSPALLIELLHRGIRCCGTVRKNRRDLPKELISTASQLQDNEYAYRQRGKLGAVAWKDRRLVYLLTTHTSPAEVTSIERQSEDGSTVQRAVPTAVADYNQHKSGVDTVDQLHASYLIGRKSKKWWPRLVWWLIDMCIVNAYSLYQQQQPIRITQLQFRQRLLEQLLEQYKQEGSTSGSPSSTSHSRHHQQHWPQHTATAHDCVCCSMQPEKRVRSNFQCKLCHVHLCIDPCFELYHQTREQKHPTV
jgi:Transposase IS4